MKKRPLIWHIYPSYLWLILVAMLAVAVSASRITKAFHYEQTAGQLTSAAHLVAEQLKAGAAEEGIDALCKTLGRSSGYRLTVIGMDGIVAGDSEESPAEMDNHGNREEVVAAIAEGIGQSCRFSDTLRQEMMYVAIPLVVDGRQQAVVRASLSLERIDAALRSIWIQFLIAGVVIAVVAVAASALIVRRINRPMRRLRGRAEAFVLGETYERPPSSGISELDVLADALSGMARELHVRIGTISRQYDEISALLACMTEGVIAVDEDKRVLRMNAAALELFGVEAGACEGKGLMEVVRNAELYDLVEKTLGTEERVEGGILLTDLDRRLQVHGTVLHGKGGNRVGAVIVLSDVTSPG
jgi:two-component system phosphate regulon sensor histidine kinase PhoR